MIYRVIIAGALLLVASTALAGFLEMPDTSEVPEYERESMLLDMDIPALKDRDPNPEAGPRLNVREFRVQGLVEYPELGITRKEIINKVEKIRFDLMSEGKLLDSGYSVDEIAEVSDLVAEIEKNTEGRHVTPVEVQKFVFLIRDQRRKRGVTLGMIETVADTITRYYRERGFILAKAYIPKQHVRDGVVTITLLLGNLGEVDVQNNKKYSSRIINRVFDSSLSKPVLSERVEENIYLINDLPGLVARGYFEPGGQIGDTKLNINVTDEKSFYSNIRLDNHGSEMTGEYRAYTDFYWNNLSGFGDQLQLGALGSFDPDNSTYGSLRYSIPIFTPRWMMSISASTNDFVTTDISATGADFKSTGKSEVSELSFSYKKRRTRTNNQKFNVIYSHIESELRYGDIANFGSNKVVDRLDLSYDFDFLNEKQRLMHQGNIMLSAAELVKGEELGQDTNTYILSFDYSRLSFIDIPFINKNARFITHAAGQYSGEALSEVLQFGLGGPTRSRAYKINEFYADDALYLGADIVFNGPAFKGKEFFGEKLGSLIQPTLFFDGAYGKAIPYERGDDSTNVALVDIGIGLKLNFREGLRGNFSLAFPVWSENSLYDANNEAGVPDSGSGDEETENVDLKHGDGARLYFDLQYGF